MQQLCSLRRSLLFFIICGAAASWRGVVFFRWFSDVADGRIVVISESAAENTTLTPELRSRIDAGVIVALNPADGDGPVFINRCGKLFNASDSERERRAPPKFMHVPKAAGKTLEKFLRTGFTGHDARKFKKKTGNFVTVFRHPIDWLLSKYYFTKSGVAQADYKNRQKKFCEHGTGKAFGVECIPKETLYKFAKDRAGSNQQLKFLMRTAEDSVEQTAGWVLSNCVLFGASDEVLDLELFLARAFPGQTLEPSVMVANAVEHGTLDELLTVGEYTELVQLAKDEISFYYWVKSMSRKFRFCYGESRFKSAYSEATKGHA